MSLKSSTKVDTNVYELEIEVDGKTFEEAIQKAYHKLKNRVNVPGFRKGKAPRSIIEKMYGPEIFYEEAIDIAYPEVVEAAIKEAGLDIIDTPFDVSVPDVGKEGFSLKLKATVKPEIEIDNYKGIEATRKSTVLEESEMEEQIGTMLERSARYVSVEDKAIEEGDMTNINFEGFVDGEAFEGGKAEGFDLTIGSGQFIPGFEDQTIGHKLNDEFDINVSFPEDYNDKLAGKEAVFKVRINEIKQKELPELNDDFVKDISEFDTLVEFKADLKEQLEKQKKDESEMEFESQLLDGLAALVTAEIPDAMIERQIDENVNDFGYRMQSQGIDIETYLNYTGSNMEAFRETLRPQAENQVKTKLALEKIAELEKIEPNDEDLEKEYARLAEVYGVELDVVKNAIQLNDIKESFKTNKAIEIVKDAAVVTEEKADAKKSEKKTEKKATAEEKTTTAKKTTAKTATAKTTEEKTATDKKPAAKKTTTAKKPAAKKDEKEVQE